MGLIKFYNRAKKSFNKSTFSHKNAISFQAYELLKKYVVRGIVEPDKLDSAYPKNTKLKVLKNVSHRSMRTFYKLSDRNKKNQRGILSQANNVDFSEEKKLSPKAKKLLRKINKDLPRYQEIDSLIQKCTSR